MIEKLKRFNWFMLISMLSLIAIGTVSIWSAGNARAEQLFHGIWKSNLATAGFGLLLYMALSFTDYRKTLDYAAIPAYAVSIIMLISVLIFGSTIYGGRRWLWFFQPSEISKLCVIALFASLFGDVDSKLYAMRKRFGGFLAAASLAVIPAWLILKEPDLGTTLALVPAIVVMMFSAGIWRKGLVTITLIGGISAAAILGAVYEAEKPGVSEERKAKIMEYVPLRPHQVARVKVFLFPEEDVTGAGYTLRQAKISIGSGGFSGKGVGKGETNHLKYLPQAISMNDFIFCVYAEEFGFVGSMVLLGLFGLLLLSCCWVALRSNDGRGRLLAIGVATLIFAHVYINIAMSIGIVPITGLPLPFISSGRTFLIVLMCGLGLVQSVSIHREEQK